jgi:hypothetical protein
MAEGIAEFASSLLDTLAFFLASPDVIGKERIERVGLYLQTVRKNVVASVRSTNEYLSWKGSPIFFAISVVFSANYLCKYRLSL